MELNKLPKIKISKKARRVGRGHGSGRGKTAGRGTKGQKARRKIKLTFEGGALPLIKRLPFTRGKGKNKIFKIKPIIINIRALNGLPANTIIDLNTLIKNKFVKEDEARLYGVKLLGEGELTKPLIIKIPVSNNVRKKIEKIGGKVESG
ncbi:50S ribosomal protein L15 [Candidatus Parcubacteria bacterium]|nr:MAG: 50S ribosomal protein L15 [Candidatus Parcubacteria bacterium]